MKKFFLLTIISLFSLSSFAAVKELHNDELANAKSETGRGIPDNMKRCPITAVESYDPEAMIDLAGFATVNTEANQTLKTFYVYHGESSPNSIPRDELSKVQVLSVNGQITKTWIEFYKLSSKTFAKDVKAGKIDFPGFALKKIYSCNHGF